MTRPEVSVVIPTFDRPDRLRRALEGTVRHHDGVAIEIVVVDDGSRDEAGVANAVSMVAAGGGISVTLIRQANLGPSAARNAGASAAVGGVVLFLDDDCVPDPGCIGIHRDMQVKAAKSSEVLAVLGHARWDPELPVTPLMYLAMRGAQFDYDGIADPNNVPFSRFYTACASVPRDQFLAMGGFDATLPRYAAGEDTEFAWRWVQGGRRIAYRADATVRHDHQLELRPFLERQRRAGRAAVEVVARHPQLFEALGLGAIADVGAREQFYVALMRYAWIIGVEEGLGAPTRPDDLPGEHLRSVVEEWLPAWAITAASERRAWQARAEAMTAAVAERDARLAEVVQAKDARIAALEVELGRLHRFPPVQVARAIAGWFRRGP
jgi:glycosyltransferase involved in cell wall biosynthesis